MRKTSFDGKGRIRINITVKETFADKTDLKVVFFDDHISVLDKPQYSAFVEAFATEIGNRDLAYRVVAETSEDLKFDAQGRYNVPKARIKKEWENQNLKVFAIEKPEGSYVEVYPEKEFDKLVQSYLGESGGLKASLKGRNNEERRRED